MIDQLYNDFTTKILPKISEGLTITKDYFFDLFGRYVHYLIVVDSIALGINVFLFVGSIITMMCILKWAFESFLEDANPMGIILFILLGGTILVSFVESFSKADNLIKDIYIPEIRIYEELKPLL